MADTVRRVSNCVFNKRAMCGEINFGMGLRFIESGIATAESTSESNRNYLVKYSGLPLTSDGTLIIVMLLQVGAFYFFSKKSDPTT